MGKAAIIDMTIYMCHKFTPLNLRRLHMKFEINWPSVFVWFDSLRAINNLSVKQGRGLSGLLFFGLSAVFTVIWVFTVNLGTHLLLQKWIYNILDIFCVSTKLRGN